MNYLLIQDRLLYSSETKCIYEFTVTEYTMNYPEDHICNHCQLPLPKVSLDRNYCRICTEVHSHYFSNRLPAYIHIYGKRYSELKVYVVGYINDVEDENDSIFINTNHSFQMRPSLYMSKYFKRVIEL